MKLLFDAVMFQCVLFCFCTHAVEKIDACKIERGRQTETLRACADVFVCVCVSVCLSVCQKLLSIDVPDK